MQTFANSKWNNKNMIAMIHFAGNYQNRTLKKLE
jgi:hypothetical protein